MGTDLIVPTSREAVLVLDSPTLYLLEQAGEIAREILDGRVIEWTAQGWTQQKIADEIGCDRATVSRRQGRLGVEPTSPRGRPKAELCKPHNSANGATAEPQLEDWLPDMLPGADPAGAFRQAVVAWCDQERLLGDAMGETGITLVPKSERDRQALRNRLADIHTTAARLEGQLE